MLLAVRTAKRHLTAALIAASIAAVPAAPALAWGDREQGFVAGIAAAVILDQIIRNERRHRMAEVIHVERPVHTATPIHRSPAARAFQSYPLSERKAIQRSLRAYGYYRGRIDGSFGPGTYNAVLAFARDEGAVASLNTPAGAFGIFDGLIH